MTRRSFIKGMAALSGGYIAARFAFLEIPGHEPLMELVEFVEPEIVETPVTLSDPLAHLVLDGERFDLLRFGDIDVQYGEELVWYAADVNVPGQYKPVLHSQVPVALSWETDCDFPLDDLDRMEEVSRRRGPLPMMIAGGMLGDRSFHGLARIAQTAITFRARDHGFGSVVLVGNDFLRVEIA